MSENGSLVSFPYDAFCIAVLLAVACGSIVVAVFQVEAIIYFANKITFLIFTSVITLSLVLSLLAAFFKHQQTEKTNKANEMTDKAKQLEERKGESEKIDKAIIIYKRQGQSINISASKFSKISGLAVRGATLTILISFIFLIGAVWYTPITEMMNAEAEQVTEEAGDELEAEEEE